MARICKRCHTIENNMAVFRCKVCNEVLPLENIDVNEEKRAQKWYIRCKSCGIWISFEDKNKIPKSCPECYEIGINNIGEDSILSEEEYLVEIGEKQLEIEDIDNEENLETSESIVDDLKIQYVEFLNKSDGKLIQISHGEYMLGRTGDIDAGYFADKKFIGRKHAMVFVDKEAVYIQDWNSTNRTRINGEFIYKEQGKMRIVNGDTVTMADQNFEVRICR